ncbi:hypothetical protein ACFFRR_000574 [Megaselia abdita]
MLASNLSTEIHSFDNMENFYKPHNMDDTDLKITSQDFFNQDFEDLLPELNSNIFDEGQDSNINNSQNSIYTGVGDIMLGAGNDWCDGISQSKYVTSSLSTNTMKRKATTMTNTILPVKRNKLDLTVRIQPINAQEPTSTSIVGQNQVPNTANICDDILDMQTPAFPIIPIQYEFTYSPETEACQDYQSLSPVPEPSQIIVLPHSPATTSSSIISDFKQEDLSQFSPSTEFSAPPSPASSYPFSPSTNLSSPNSNTTNSKRRRGRPAKIISTEPDEAELSKCKTKAEREHYLRRFRNNEASRKSRLLNKQRTEKVDQDIRQFEQENMSLDAAVESDQIKIKLLKDYIKNKLTANIHNSYNNLVH